MTSAGKWYADCYRRNLVDMHIEDWNEEFLSEFSPEEYVANLKRAHIEAPMIYLQSHVGHCYWPTETGHMHAALKGRENLMRELIRLCREAGMHPVGYYSLIYNTYEEDRHPEWRIITGEDGSSARSRGGRYGHCCPNNPGYRAFLKAQIHEMAELFHKEEAFRVDGMFYDMTFWPGECRCEHCQDRYRRESGKEESFLSLPWEEQYRYRVEWMGEFAHFVTDYTRAVMPGITVEHNCAGAIASGGLNSNTELVIDACDYAAGDLYGDLYNHSFAAKYYYGATKNQPFEYMTCRAVPNLGSHTITKDEDALATEVMLTAAHHGASFIIDAIDPVGTLDSRVYDRIGRVFERQMPYEEYFRGEMVQDVGVYYSTTGNFNRHGLKYTNKPCAVNAVRAMIEAHIPVGVINNFSTDRLSGYKAVIAPAINGISDPNRADLAAYVENGGLLYISGAEDEELLKRFFGVSVTGWTEESAVYMAPTEAGQPYFGEFNPKYPLPTELPMPILTPGDYEVLATMKLPYTKPGEQRFASIHSNPPGIATDKPALITKAIGRGRVIWSAVPIENDTRRAHRRLLLALLNAYMDKPTLSSTAPRQVELVTFRDGRECLVSAVDLLCSDELLPVRRFTVTIECDKPTHVLRLGGRDHEAMELPFQWHDGQVSFAVDSLVMFDMIRIY